MNGTTATLSDEELALEAQAGSRRCFEELVERYSPKLFNFLRPKIASSQDIEDIIQEIFFKLYKNIFRYDPQWKFSTWIYTATNRMAISHFRSKQNRNNSELPTYTDENPEDILIKEVQSQNIWKLVQNLKPDYYRVLWLRYVEEMSSKEIATVMRKTHVAVRLLLHRARLNLEKQLQPSLILKKEILEKSPGSKNYKYTENRG